jgi:hypothetical protein
MVNLLHLFLLLIQEGLFLFLNIVSTLEEKPRILDSQILTLINLHRLVPLPHSPLLLLLELVQFRIGQHLRLELLLHGSFLFLRATLGQFLEVLLVLSLEEGAPSDRLPQGDNGV